MRVQFFNLPSDEAGRVFRSRFALIIDEYEGNDTTTWESFGKNIGADDVIVVAERVEILTDAYGTTKGRTWWVPTTQGVESQ